MGIVLGSILARSELMEVERISWLKGAFMGIQVH
jgi:hypothetical protein